MEHFPQILGPLARRDDAPPSRRARLTLQPAPAETDVAADPAANRISQFRDNALFSRFELYRDGALAGYVQYEMRGGQVFLLHAVVDPRFRREGLEPVLLRAVLLDAHRRRLAVMPQCPEAQQFLTDHPQFLPLIPARQRRRVRLLMASRAAGQARR
jgi:predicted GNAT family acetyltransferase